MKKKFLTLILSFTAMLMCIFSLTACTGVQFEINFIVDGEVYETVSTSGQGVIKMPENPSKENYTFDGWYWDKDTWQTPFTANSLLDAPLSSDMSVYAKFTKNHTHEYNSVVTEPTCTEKGYTTYTCTCRDSYLDDYVDELGHEYGAYISNGDGTHTKTCANDNSHKITEDCTFDSNKACKECGYTTTLLGTEISSDVFTINGTNLYVKVPNNQGTFYLGDAVEVADGVTYGFYTHIQGTGHIGSYLPNLNVGDNKFYMIVNNNGVVPKTYTVVIRRRPMYDVTFNSNGGSAVSKQTVEEDFWATEPTTTRAGYDFDGWDYDFTTPITKNTEINAKWTANTVSYKIEYYLQNLANDGYTLIETITETGVTDTDTITAEVKIFDHFTYNQSKSILRDNINGNGSTVLKVYYTRDKYSVSLNTGNSKAGSVTGSGTYKYEKELTVTATTNIGYTFLGWHEGETCVCETEEFTFKVEKAVAYVAKFELKEEMANFNFTSTITTCQITGIKDKTVTEIIVPNYVTSISSGAFEDCSSLTSVVIGDSVTSIGSYAFEYCTSLTSVVIGDSVTNIGYRAFEGCDSLISIMVDENNEYYKSIDGNLYSKDGKTLIQYAIGKTDTAFTIPDSVTSIGYSAFRGCTSLTSIEIPDSVTSIGSYAFYNCTSLTSIEIPNSVTSIGEGAFEGCRSLTSVEIPNSVTSIGSYAFYNCDSLTSIEIPNSVTRIGSSAFSGCRSLASVVIGDSVTGIGERVFKYCSSLTSVVIGDSVTSIGAWAFSDSSLLTSVYYSGTAEDWAKISIDSSNSSLTSVTRYYYIENESDLPADNGNYWHYVDGVPTVWTKD